MPSSYLGATKSESKLLPLLTYSFADLCISSILLFIILFFVIAGLTRIGQVKKLGILIGYGAIALAEYSNDTFLFIYEYDGELQNTMLNIFVLTEFSAFGIFLKEQIRSDAGKRMMLFFLQFFPLAVCFYWLYKDGLSNSPICLIITGSFIILFSSLYYYYEIFTEPPDVSFREHPPFLAVSGMFILSAFSVPLSIYMDYNQPGFSPVYNALYSMKCVAYIILFTFFILALKCQIRTR